MSFIQISKKAVTEADARALLDASFALSNPFGVAVIHLSGRFACAQVEKDEFDATKARVVDFIRQNAPKACVKGVVAATNMWVNDTFPEDNTILNRHEFGAFCMQVRPDDLVDYGDRHDDPSTFEKPEAALIVMPNSDITVTKMQSHFFATKLKPLPGSTAQGHFHTLWHEYAHAGGGNEPQADAIAAVMCRRAFRNNQYLQVHADQRAVSTVLWKGTRQRYGWGCVDATDYGFNLASGVAEGMREDDIENIKFQKFDPLIQTVGEVYDKLLEHDVTYAVRAGCGFTEMAGAAISALHHTNLSEQHGRILRRFQLACTRLSIGRAAYKEGNDLVDPELLASSEEPPISFKPGQYIPEVG
ncbi:MAG: hypothetical protein GC137_02590 [Alphaproteobacteria bacterium]|nr:hypothetical protein [Alphaproteobacteria bacterium]